ncbi:MAG: hypothetical protein GY727_15585, partial [Gammaproteobacteria bacterium]|nr:hypothetical protein [Gammaproteobacteria bacterium]
TLLLTFNTNATSALVDSTLQSIAYSNSSDDPPATVQIDWSFSDGNTGSQGTGGALQATGSTTVTITPTNVAPTDIKLDGGDSESINENRPIGSRFSTITSVDADVNDNHTYSLVAGTGDTDNASFTIVGVSLQTNAALNYETQNSYSIRIQTDDGKGGTYAEAFTISIVDITTEVDAAGVKVWDLNTPGDFTVSDAINLEVDEGIGRLILDNTPVHVGAITNNVASALNGARGITVVGDYAYVASFIYDGVEILDISDPANPTHVGAIRDNAARALDGAMGITVVGDYAYVASVLDNGVEILDISDPANPTHVGAIFDSGPTALSWAWGITVVGDYAYVASYNDDGVEILDISDPSNPTHVGSITDNATTELDGARAITVVGDYAYVTSCNDDGV